MTAEYKLFCFVCMLRDTADERRELLEQLGSDKDIALREIKARPEDQQPDLRKMLPGAKVKQETWSRYCRTIRRPENCGHFDFEHGPGSADSGAG